VEERGTCVRDAKYLNYDALVESREAALGIR